MDLIRSISLVGDEYSASDKYCSHENLLVTDPQLGGLSDRTRIGEFIESICSIDNTALTVLLRFVNPLRDSVIEVVLKF